MFIPKQIEPAIALIIANGGRPFVVGGSVRDFIMGLPPKDFDIEIFNMSLGDLEVTLRPFGKVNLVGQAFGIINLRIDGESFDFSIPRRENRIGVGHKDFLVECDPNLTARDAAARRDFTCNAIMFDLIKRELVDPFNGQADIQKKILRPTSEAFKEDALRVLRGMQFAARFGFEIRMDFVEQARLMRPDFEALPKERLWGEWEKWALKGKHPGNGLQVLLESGWLWCFPELANILNVQQDPVWHPEGKAFTHTQLVCNAAADIADREQLDDNERLILMFAALCHDFGKANCTVFENGRWRSPGHAGAGVPIADEFLRSIGCPNIIRDNVLPLVAEHMAHCGMDVNKRNLRRLALRLGVANIEQLLRVIEADMSGRPPLPKGLPVECVTMREMAKDLSISKVGPKAIVMGRHLIELGFKPGPDMGLILKDAFDSQMNGEFDSVDSGLEWVKKNYMEEPVEYFYE